MDLESIVEARIHPAIGIARIGNSDEYFIGPQVPHPTPPPTGGYRDASGKLKRQAAQFRIFGYDSNGDVVAELTSLNAHIEGTVHVGNQKGAWYDFDAALDLPEAKDLKSCRRNAFLQGEQREQLVIDPARARSRVRIANQRPSVRGGFSVHWYISVSSLPTMQDGWVLSAARERRPPR